MKGLDAAALAAFRRDHPAWSVRPVDYGDGFTAQRGASPSLYGRTLAELADQIADAEGRKR